MKSALFADARDGEARRDREAQILSAAAGFKVLAGLLEKKIQGKQSLRDDPKNYELPSYSEMQADASGYIRALREVQSLIDLEDKA